MAKTLMAVDAGTGSVRAVLFSLDGEQLGCVQQEWTHKEDPRYPGSMDFDWVHNWELARGCIRGVIEQTGVDPHDIAAVSTTCMREGIVLYDKDGREIWACANVDARSDDEVAQLVHMNPELEKQIYRESGQTYALGALPRLFWVKNKMPEVYEKTALCTMFNDWLIYKMTGVFSSEPSNACTTGIFDLKARDWDDQIAASIGLKTGIFPKMYECGTVVAQVRPVLPRARRLSRAAAMRSWAASASAWSMPIRRLSSAAASGSMNTTPMKRKPTSIAVSA